MYGYEVAFNDYGFSDPTILRTLYRNSSMPYSPLISIDDDLFDRKPRPTPPKTAATPPNKSPPRHRHDGTSPLPLGMDWSPPPRVWDGPNSVWPHDPHTGWSYCVTIPSWTIPPHARGSDAVVFYRVQVGIQSPEGITTTRGVLRRFNDFLQLFSELKKEFPKKTLPAAPPRRLLKRTSKTLLEERRCALEDWLEKLLSDIDLSRTALVAIFLELEAAVRFSFSDSSHNVSDGDSVNSMAQFSSNSETSFHVGNSSITLDCDKDSAYGTPEHGTLTYQRDNFAESNLQNTSSEDFSDPSKETIRDNYSGDVIGGREDFVHGPQVMHNQHKMHSKGENSAIDACHTNEMDISSSLDSYNLQSNVHRLPGESVGSVICSIGNPETSNSVINRSLGDNYRQHLEHAEASRTSELLLTTDLKFPGDLLVTLPSDERHKVNRILVTTQQRLDTAKMDMEDLIVRLNQEIVARQYLTTKVKDLEAELEVASQSGKESLQQAILTEREQLTQMQWDLEEHRRKRMEMELKLNSEQDARLHMEAMNLSIVQENKMLLQELGDAKERIGNLNQQRDELESKSKSDIKQLVKEVKSLRTSQSELKQQLEEEKQKLEHANAAMGKLLHECKLLCNRLKECSGNFLTEDDDKVIIDTSPSDAIDLLATSDNRIGLLIAEAQLHAQDVEKSTASADENINSDDAKADEDFSEYF